MINVWDINAYFYDEVESRLSKDINKLTFNYLKKNNLLRYKNVLDLFCGTGNVSISLLDLNVKKIVAIDNSKLMLNRFNHKIRSNKQKNKLKIIKLDILNSNLNKIFGHERFDVIYIKRALYFSDKENIQILKQAHKLLNKNGVIVVINPEKNLRKYIQGRILPFSISSFLRRLWAWIGIGINVVNYKLYTSNQFVDLCEKNFKENAQIIRLNAPSPSYYIIIIKSLK